MTAEQPLGGSEMGIGVILHTDVLTDLISLLLPFFGGLSDIGEVSSVLAL